MMNRAKILAVATCLILNCRTCFGADDAELRAWTDASGSFTLEAAFVGVADGVVKLRRSDGKELTVKLSRLSSADRQYIDELTDGDAGPKTTTPSKLTGKPEELANDDGKPAGQKSFPRGIASAFHAPDGEHYLTSVRIHGGRYGYPQAPDEDFHVTLCDKDFKPIADFDFPYKRFQRGEAEWVTLRVKPTQVPAEFVVCLNFNPTQTKGVYVSHDGEGKSLVGLPDKPAGTFGGGDWLVRVSLDQLKGEE
ncbi:MAG: hypothetical protein KDA63_14750 [Planctomycetales bacterium]|nr:hypothetical protein [Planctomycetales bacterium]